MFFGFIQEVVVRGGSDQALFFMSILISNGDCLKSAAYYL